MNYRYHELEEANLIESAIYEGGNQNNPMKDDPLVKLFKFKEFKRGLGNQGGFRKSTKEINGIISKGDFAFVVIVDSRTQIEWPNSYDSKSRVFTYYGDNRTPNNPILETKNRGNEFLLDIFQKAYDTSKMRIQIPPIFIFQSTENRCDKKFIGLAVPGERGKSFDDVLEKKLYNTNEGMFENYCAKFTVLPLESEGINRAWLRELKSQDFKISLNAPESWRNFILFGHEGSLNYPSDNIEVMYEDYSEYTTEKESSVKVRIVQGKFRNALIKRDKCCLICGLDISDLLRASHIKPWTHSKSNEQIDQNNGLLLCAIHDALFDKGFISFSDEGKILISKSITVNQYEKLQIRKDIRINLSSKQQDYMAFHRENIFKNNF